jgi:hypothetical protein
MVCCSSISDDETDVNNEIFRENDRGVRCPVYGIEYFLFKNDLNQT